MSTTSAPEKPPPDALEYAESLYDYAAQRLDPFSLRCWIIRRLMLDAGLAHLAAEEVFDRVLASANDGAYGVVHGRLSEPRHQSSRRLRSSARERARRLHFHRPTGHACA